VGGSAPPARLRQVDLQFAAVEWLAPLPAGLAPEMGPLAASAAAAANAAALAAGPGSPGRDGGGGGDDVAAPACNPWAASPRAGERAASGCVWGTAWPLPRRRRPSAAFRSKQPLVLCISCTSYPSLHPLPALPSLLPFPALPLRLTPPRAHSLHPPTLPPPSPHPACHRYPFQPDTEEPAEERLAFTLADGRTGVLGVRGRRISDARPRRPAWQALASGGA
jgi:hypothetical protein